MVLKASTGDSPESVNYLFPLFWTHTYILLLVLLTSNGVLDCHLEGFPGGVSKPWDVRYLDCTVRTVDTRPRYRVVVPSQPTRVYRV